mmetsp:Transcript_9037/g.12508  ORF Transcript_9037/g.12508 Transcript_9037/m.12508 type:complete len:100 (+) Transcript_9037:1315-1614(+)
MVKKRRKTASLLTVPFFHGWKSFIGSPCVHTYQLCNVHLFHKWRERAKKSETLLMEKLLLVNSLTDLYIPVINCITFKNKCKSSVVLPDDTNIWADDGR